MKKYMLLSAALLLFTASCSNDENNEQKEPTQAVQFSFTNEEFGADETLTRSAETAKPQIVDLGDCEAEISVESEPAAKTRGAKTPANGHYTIRAYQAGTLKGEMKGTFSAGTFTPDASSPKDIVIPAGTYDFIAFNDDVTPSGTNLTTTRDKAETARMGFATQVITATPHKQTVNFTMKHMGCRLRTQFVCKKDIPNNITAQLEGAAANVIPTSVAYNPTTKAYTATNGAMAPESSNSPASPTSQIRYFASNGGQKYSYTSTSPDYHYFLPTTEASNLKLSFSAGTVFWKSITVAQKLSLALSMQAGKSYLIKLKLKPNYTYLMSDGTTGHFKDTTFGGGTKTPIAIVVNPDKKIAIALKPANGGNPCLWTSNIAYQSWGGVNTDQQSSYGGLIALENGYEETWDGNYSTALVTGEKIKGKRADFPAFKACADYNPGVPVTGANISKWYLPAYGEWKYAAITLGFTSNLALATNFASHNWYGNLAKEAFTQVGGDLPLSTTYHPHYGFWSSSEFLNAVGYVHLYNNVGPSGFYYSGKNGIKENYGDHYLRVQPFVKY